MKNSTDMTHESLFQGLQSLSISAENVLSNQSEFSAQNASGAELLYPEGITPTQHILLPEHPHTSSISSVQGLLPDEGSYDQSFPSIHNNLPTELPCTNTMPSALNDSSSGEKEFLDLCAGSAESVAHVETHKNKTDNIKKPTILFIRKSQRARMSTIQTASGPVLYLPTSQQEAVESQIPPIPESMLRNLYEARERLLQDKDLSSRLMMSQRLVSSAANES